MQAEVLYGILGASMRMQDPEAAVVALRIYNDWLGDFCATSPERLIGLANIPNAPIEAAVEEIHRVAKVGKVRGLDVANSPDMVPLWDPYWEPMWQAAAETGLPVHFHTLGGKRQPDKRGRIHGGGGPARRGEGFFAGIRSPVQLLPDRFRVGVWRLSGSRLALTEQQEAGQNGRQP